jgi:hypothetical protein
VAVKRLTLFVSLRELGDITQLSRPHCDSEEDGSQTFHMDRQVCASRRHGSPAKGSFAWIGDGSEAVAATLHRRAASLSERRGQHPRVAASSGRAVCGPGRAWQHMLADATRARRQLRPPARAQAAGAALPRASRAISWGTALRRADHRRVTQVSDLRDALAAWRRGPPCGSSSQPAELTG